MSERVEAMRAYHQPNDAPVGPHCRCRQCGQVWPCEPAQLLTAYDALREERDRLASELPDMSGAHYVNIVVRRNGREEVHEADYLQRIKHG